MNEELILELVRAMTFKDAPRKVTDDDGYDYVELTESLEDLLRAVYGMNEF